MTPHMIHWIQMGGTIRQPEEFHVQLGCQSLRSRRSMARMLIEHHGNVPAAVAPANGCFFSPVGGLVAARSAAVSRRSPVRADAAESCRPRASGRPTKLIADAAMGPSNSRHAIPIGWAFPVGACPTVPADRASN